MSAAASKPLTCRKFQSFGTSAVVPTQRRQERAIDAQLKKYYRVEAKEKKKSLAWYPTSAQNAVPNAARPAPTSAGHSTTHPQKPENHSA